MTSARTGSARGPHEPRECVELTAPTSDVRLYRCGECDTTYETRTLEGTNNVPAVCVGTELELAP